MGIIRVITANELVGGEGDSHIYPVTSVKAIFDMDNKPLNTILDETNTRMELIDKDVLDVKDISENARGEIAKLQNKIHEVDSNYNELKLSVENIPENSGGVFRGTLKESNMSKGADTLEPQYQVCGLYQCSFLNSIADLKNGDIIIPEKEGSYNLFDQVYNIDQLTLLLKQGDRLIAIPLGIPIIPMLPNQPEDYVTSPASFQYVLKCIWDKGSDGAWKKTLVWELV